jgi:hypothetical protein
MEQALQEASLRSRDPCPPDQPTLYHKVYTGRPGRPRHAIDPQLLESVFNEHHRGPTFLAPRVGCSSRTVRRRALENGIAEPGPPVYVEYEDEDTGVKLRWYTSSTPAMSTLTDDELDEFVASVLRIFPFFGREMIDGQLRHHGHRVPRERLRASYERVMGLPAQFFGRRIERRRYRVAGPNSLWHHDGQHGMDSYNQLDVYLIL